MKRLFFVLLLLINCPFLQSFAQSLDFSKTGDINSNKVLANYIEDEFPDIQPNVVSYFYDIDNNGVKDVIGIVKSNVFYTLKGYKLFVLKNNDGKFEPIKTDVYFDNTKPLIIENSTITYYRGDFYNNKRYSAHYKNNSINTLGLFLDAKRNSKVNKIEAAIKPTYTGKRNEIPLKELHGSNQKTVEINYKK